MQTCLTIESASTEFSTLLFSFSPWNDGTIVDKLTKRYLFYLQHFQSFEGAENYQWQQVGYSIVPQNSVDVELTKTAGKDIN